MIHRRIFLIIFLAGISKSVAVTTASTATQSGREFLADLLDAELGLLPEFLGAKVYWLSHDNVLATKVLATSHPKIADIITAALQREKMPRTDGRMEMFFGKAHGVLPFRHHQLIDVRLAGDKRIRTEIATDQPNTDWQHYADLLFLGSIAETNQSTARQHFEAAMKFWDGQGFADAVFPERKIYATYKLALALLAARKLSPPADASPAMIQRLLSLQSETGGWITDYDAAGKKIGLANVETTCLAILALESVAANPTGVSRRLDKATSDPHPCPCSWFH